MGNFKKNKPFIVAKFVSTSMGVQNNEYEQIYNPDRETATISREKAMDLIEEYDMVVVYRGIDGTIWDTKDHTFFEKYKGFFKAKEENEQKKQQVKEATNTINKVQKISEIKEQIKNKRHEN